MDLKEQARNQAYSVVSRLIELRGHSKPPFRPAEYAKLLGVERIVKQPFDPSTSAMVLKHENNTVIHVNETHSLSRRNFSIAHELGHLLLDEIVEQKNQFAFRSLCQASEEEKLCDSIASELLMPREIFNRYLDTFGNSICSVDKLANVFQVSIPSTAIRIAELSSEVCVAIRWKSWEAKNCLRYDWHSIPVVSEKPFFYKPVDLNIPNTSAIYRAYTSSEIIKTQKTLILNQGVKKKCYIESKGFGYGKNRYVLSLAYPER